MSSLHSWWNCTCSLQYHQPPLHFVNSDHYDYRKIYIDQLFLLHYDNRKTIILCKYPTFVTGMLDHLMKYLHLLFRPREPSIRNRHCISVSSEWWSCRRETFFLESGCYKHSCTSCKWEDSVGQLWTESISLYRRVPPTLSASEDVCWNIKSIERGWTIEQLLYFQFNGQEFRSVLKKWLIWHDCIVNLIVKVCHLTQGWQEVFLQQTAVFEGKPTKYLEPKAFWEEIY